MRKTLGFIIGIVIVLALFACNPQDGPPDEPGGGATSTPTPGGPGEIGTEPPEMGSLEVNVTFEGRIDCDTIVDSAWIKVENTSTLVYKQMVVQVRDGGDAAPNWANFTFFYNTFFTTGLVCTNPPAVHFPNVSKLKPTRTSHSYDLFMPKDDAPFYTLYYIICTWKDLSGECAEGGFPIHGNRCRRRRDISLRSLPTTGDAFTMRAGSTSRWR